MWAALGKADETIANSSGLISQLQVVHCTALHCTALHCTALHCTALHCTTKRNVGAAAQRVRVSVRPQQLTSAQ